VVFLVPDFAPTRLFDNIGALFRPNIGLETTAEARGMGISDLFIYLFLTIPLLIGMYHTLRRRRPSDILWLTWFLLFFFFGLFSRRVFIVYAAVAGCMLAGLGLEAIYSFQSSRSYQQLKKLAAAAVTGCMPSGLGLGVIYSFRSSRLYQRLKKVAAQLIVFALLFLSLVVSFVQAYQLGSGGVIAADNGWCGALAYLKENTPENAVIMTWWDYGYWILDLAERTPVVDNGYRPDDRLRDIARAYCTNQDSEAIEVMQKYGASYLIFAKADIAKLPVISLYGLGQSYGDGKSVPLQLAKSLFSRAPALSQSDEPLVVAYCNDGVVILRLQQPEP
jgi:dolichyl-diphosphooligosaccharide--protein glycosyltransferase